MKPRLPVVLLVMGFAGAVFAAEVEIEFSGVLGSGKDLRFALTNKANGVMQWVPLGGSIAGHTVLEYDAKADVLLLAHDGQQLRLTLKGRTAAKTAGKISPEVEKAVLNNLRQLAAAADQYYLEHGKNTTTYDELVGPTKYVKAINPVDGENYRALQFIQGQRFTVMTSTGHTVSYEN